MLVRWIFCMVMIWPKCIRILTNWFGFVNNVDYSQSLRTLHLSPTAGFRRRCVKNCLRLTIFCGMNTLLVIRLLICTNKWQHQAVAWIIHASKRKDRTVCVCVCVCVQNSHIQVDIQIIWKSKGVCIMFLFFFVCSESNWVSGSDRPHVLWNQKGQHLIRNHIEWYLSKVLKIEFPERVRFAA